jgi:hypothetical protein
MHELPSYLHTKALVGGADAAATRAQEHQRPKQRLQQQGWLEHQCLTGNSSKDLLPGDSLA